MKRLPLLSAWMLANLALIASCEAEPRSKDAFATAEERRQALTPQLESAAPTRSAELPRAVPLRLDADAAVNALKVATAHRPSAESGRCHEDLACGPALAIDPQGRRYISLTPAARARKDDANTNALGMPAIARLNDAGEAAWIKRVSAEGCFGITRLAASSSHLFVVGYFTERLRLGRLALEQPQGARNSGASSFFLAVLAQTDGATLRAELLGERFSASCGPNLAVDTGGAVSLLAPLSTATQLAPALSAQRTVEVGVELARLTFDEAGYQQSWQSQTIGPFGVDETTPMSPAPLGTCDPSDDQMNSACGRAGNGCCADTDTTSCIAQLWGYLDCPDCGGVNLCETGPAKNPNTCILVKNVCKDDPWCCDHSWDAICVGEHLEWNGPYCPSTQSCLF